LGLFIITLLTGIISGSYPSFYLSGFHPTQIFKSSFRSVKRGKLFRQILVISQFAIAIGLMVGAGVVNSQLHYIRNKNLGFDRDHLISLPPRRTIVKEYEYIRQQLLKNPNVSCVSSGSLPGGWRLFQGRSDVDWEGKDAESDIEMYTLKVNHDYIETMKMTILQGRSFSHEFLSDETQGFIINEAAAKVIGGESPIGKLFALGEKEGRIIGVVKDFHFASLHHQIAPIILHIDNSGWINIIVRVNQGGIPATLTLLKKLWGEIEKEYPFDYSFADDRINRAYKGEQRIGAIFNSFTLMAIFISCLGLFGLASFTAEQRTKEIGIRKILGASVSEVVFLLIKDFTKWVVLANLVAWPAAYFVMNRWLQNFTFRTRFGLELFFMAGLLSLAIAVITVGFQAVKAAQTNPVKTLRYE
jgi:putative ABC transport system permease protein